MRALVLLSGALIYATVLFSQPPSFTFYKFSNDIYNSIKSDSNSWRGGGTSTDLSFIGLYNKAIIELDKAVPQKINTTAADSSLFLKNYSPVNAKEFILAKAKSNQIIIFNEAHHNPRCRVFVTSLLKSLKEIGYNYFAAETFSNQDFFSKVNHPTISTGYYTIEPQFGNLIREAMNVGYKLCESRVKIGLIKALQQPVYPTNAARVLLKT